MGSVISKGRVFSRQMIKNLEGFELTFPQNDLLNFDLIQDGHGIYFRIYPHGEKVKYDTCGLEKFNELFLVESFHPVIQLGI